MKQTIKSFITAVLLILSCMALPVAGEYKLPDTSIETCYDETGNVISCIPESGDEPGIDFYRQDAHYSGPQMEYNNNGDDTVTDLNTELMWQRSDDGINRNWQQACDYCDSLELAGYSDWRIPDRRELFSIVNLSQYNPAINTASFVDTKSTGYWSYSTDANDPNNAWYVNFANGYTGIYRKNNGWHVRCVRPELQSANADTPYVDNGDGTVTDPLTGLMWQQSDDDGVKRTWEEALKYSEELNLADYTDWRIPNIRELETIVDESLYAPAINTNDFINTKEDSGYWSGSTYSFITDAAWSIYFGSGGIYVRKKTTANYVRCVRQGSFDPLILEITVSKTSGYNPLPVSFTAVVTGGISPYTSTYTWNFGDDTAENNEQNPKHTYESSGTYTIVCTVMDESGLETEANLIVKVEASNLNLQIHEINTDNYETIKSLISVTDANGNVLSDLTESNFTLFEDDTEITPFTVISEESAASISLVLDYSGSMGVPGSPNIVALQTSASDFVRTLEPEDEAEIIKFNDKVSVVQTFTTDQTALIDAINTDYDGVMAALYDAIYDGITDTAAREGRKFVIAMTDGDNTAGTHTDSEVIEYALENDIQVFTIGLGSGINDLVLEDIAEQTGGIYYNALDSTELEGIYQEISKTVLHPYMFEYTTTVTDTREHDLKVEADYFSTQDSDISTYILPCGIGIECPLVEFSFADDICLTPLEVELKFTKSDDFDVSAVSADIVYSSSVLANPTVTIGTAGTASGKIVISDDVDSTTFRIGVISDENTPNDTPISNNGTLATITFEIVPNVSIGDSTDLDIEVTASGPEGYNLNIESLSRRITFERCCLGDCDGDGIVTDIELNTAYLQFLGAEVTGCNDKNGDDVVSISDAQTIINNYVKTSVEGKACDG